MLPFDWADVKYHVPTKTLVFRRFFRRFFVVKRRARF